MKNRIRIIIRPTIIKYLYHDGSFMYVILKGYRPCHAKLIENVTL